MYGEAVAYDAGLTLLQKTHGYTTGDAMKEDHKSQVGDERREPLQDCIVRPPLPLGGFKGNAPFKYFFLGVGFREIVDLNAEMVSPQCCTYIATFEVQYHFMTIIIIYQLCNPETSNIINHIILSHGI